MAYHHHQYHSIISRNSDINVDTMKEKLLPDPLATQLMKIYQELFNIQMKRTDRRNEINLSETLKALDTELVRYRYKEFHSKELKEIRRAS